MAAKQIEFVIDFATGEAKMTITGIKGKACRPIHEAFSKSLAKELGILETSNEDTPEGKEDVATISPSVTLRA